MATSRGSNPNPRRARTPPTTSTNVDTAVAAPTRLTRLIAGVAVAVAVVLVILLLAPLPLWGRAVGLLVVAVVVVAGVRHLFGTVNRQQDAASDRRAAYVAWLEAQDELPAIDAMTGQQFEDKMVALFERDGVRGVSRVGGAGDRGVDVRGTLPDGRSLILQCKRWRRDISDPELMKFIGTVHLFNPDVAVYVTASRYTQPARRTGREQGIVCLDRDQLSLWLHGTSIQSLIAMHDDHNARHRLR